MRYLWVTVKTNPQYSRQVADAAAGATRAIKVGRGLLANMGGPSEGMRRLLVAGGGDLEAPLCRPSVGQGDEVEKKGDRFRAALRTGASHQVPCGIHGDSGGADVFLSGKPSTRRKGQDVLGTQEAERNQGRGEDYMPMVPSVVRRCET